QVQHVQAADAVGLVVDVPVVAADLLVAAGAEGLVPRPGEDDHTDRGVLLGDPEGLAELEERRGAERIMPLGAVDRDLRDALGGLVDDVLVLTRPLPVDRTRHTRSFSTHSPTGHRRHHTRTNLTTVLDRPGHRPEGHRPLHALLLPPGPALREALRRPLDAGPAELQLSLHLPRHALGGAPA